MIDSHAHLFSEELKNTLETHLEEFKQAGGKHILNVSTNAESISEVISQSIKYREKYSELILTGLGIHPEEVSDNQEKNARILEVLKEQLEANEKRVVAIGECGLDYYHLSNRSELSKDSIENIKENQRNIFRECVQLSLSTNKPLSIHTRDIQDSNECIFDTFKVLTTSGKGEALGVFHSFTGSKMALAQILDLGFYVGFNGIVTYPKAENVRELLIQTPLNRILIETDCPLLPPQLARSGKRTNYKYGKPLDILEIAETIAKIKGVTVEKLFEITDSNFYSLFLTN